MRIDDNKISTIGEMLESISNTIGNTMAYHGVKEVIHYVKIRNNSYYKISIHKIKKLPKDD